VINQEKWESAEAWENYLNFLAPPKPQSIMDAFANDELFSTFDETSASRAKRPATSTPTLAADGAEISAPPAKRPRLNELRKTDNFSLRFLQTDHTTSLTPIFQ